MKCQTGGAAGPPGKAGAHDQMVIRRKKRARMVVLTLERKGRKAVHVGHQTGAILSRKTKKQKEKGFGLLLSFFFSFQFNMKKHWRLAYVKYYKEGLGI